MKLEQRNEVHVLLPASRNKVDFLLGEDCLLFYTPQDIHIHRREYRLYMRLRNNVGVEKNNRKRRREKVVDRRRVGNTSRTDILMQKYCEVVY